ncbi:MAG: ATP-binding protein [Verrucomicrobiales bacterium]
MQKNSNTEVMSLLAVSSTFPTLPDPLIERANLIQTLHDMLADTEVVAIDGPEGIGKTTLLAEFAKGHPNTAFSLFVSGASSYSYDCTMLSSDLSTQIGWALKKENFRNEETEEASQLLHSRILALQRQANFEKKIYYFIIDGLHEIPAEDSSALEMIMKILPFGLSRFRFLISGPAAMLSQRSVRPHNISPLRVVGFTIEDTDKFFKGVVEDRSLIESIHQLSKMIPGNMVVLRRIITSGTSADTLLDSISTILPIGLNLSGKKSTEVQHTHSKPWPHLHSIVVIYPSKY